MGIMSGDGTVLISKRELQTLFFSEQEKRVRTGSVHASTARVPNVGMAIKIATHVKQAREGPAMIGKPLNSSAFPVRVHVHEKKLLASP